MLARDVASKLKVTSPIAFHTPLNAGLKGGARMDPSEAKMSKSRPESAIFLHDDDKDIEKKLSKAYCPKADIEGNPVMDIARNILLPRLSKLEVERPEKFGGNTEFDSYKALEKEYLGDKLHPADLKKAVVKGLGEVLDPIRKYFKRNPKNLEAMLEISKSVSR
jgi:tyrosyl-tRNA synthetase